MRQVRRQTCCRGRRAVTAERDPIQTPARNSGELAHASSAAAVLLEALSPAEPRYPSTGPSIWFTPTALVVYRLGTYIAIPGIDIVALVETSKRSLERMAIFALNTYLHLCLDHHAARDRLGADRGCAKSEGKQGRKQIDEFARYLTVVLATVQAYRCARALMG
jgi:hypothetical protein